MNLSLQGNLSLLSKIKCELLSKTKILEKLPTAIQSLTASKTEDLSDEISDDINACFLDIVDIWKIYANQYFPSEQSRSQNRDWAKGLLHAGARAPGSTAGRLPGKGSDFTLHPACRELPLVEGQCSVKEEYPQ